MQARIMVLVAHADDESLGVGGYVPLLLSRGHQVSIVIASNGLIDTREQEMDNIPDARRACTVLGVSDLHLLNFRDQRFDEYAVADIANAVYGLELNPDVIITHTDSDLNRDHRIINEVAKIVGRPRNKPIMMLGCEIPVTSNWNAATFKPNYYVDISDTIETKITAFSTYSNELQEFPNPWSVEGIHTLAKFRGMESGFHHAEAFEVIRQFDAISL